jgi:hypothetical protein
MELANRTMFPVLAFRSMDRRDREFHVVVMRATLDIGDDGLLHPSREQTPIAVADEYFGEVNKSSVRSESDLAPFKPGCDVILNATAHAPGGMPSLGFVVEVKIHVPARKKEDTGSPILDKRLVVTAPRSWEADRRGRWTLREPVKPITSLPLHYEYAFGGECRVNLDDPDGNSVDARFRLTAQQRSRHPDGPERAPLAHTVCPCNPVGLGCADDWYLKAKKVRSLPAPQVDSPQDPVAVLGRSYAPQGFGVITKAWGQRLKLAGTYDDEWLEKRWPYLPEDFDMAYWNGANPDMLTPHLRGDETVTLSNLTPEGKLTFSLPGYFAAVKVRYTDGNTVYFSARLDTLLIEPDTKKVILVWRAVFPVYPEIDVVEALSLPQKETFKRKKIRSAMARGNPLAGWIPD